MNLFKSCDEMCCRRVEEWRNGMEGKGKYHELERFGKGYNGMKREKGNAARVKGNGKG